MRNITADMAAEFSGDGQRGILPVLLADLQFDSATLYMWSGVGSLIWNGNEYIGGGNLVGVSNLEENQELEAKGLSVTLNGIPTTLVALALLERTRGRPFRLYLGALSTTTVYDTLLKDDSAGSELLKDDGTSLLLKGDPTYIYNDLIVDPYRIFTGLMDVMKLNNDGHTASIILSVESTMLKGQRANIGRYTPEDQKKLYPLDTGLDRIPALIDKEVVW